MDGLKLTVEAKAAMIADLELELNARKEKLRAMCEAQCASLRSRLERRVNRIPASKRQMPLVEFLTPALPPAPKPAPAKAAPSKATATKTTAAKKTQVPAPAPASSQSSAPVSAPAPATRKTRAAPTTKSTTTKAKTTTTKAAPKTTTTRGKKRSSDDMSSEDKENAEAELDVPKKRVRAAVSKAPATKPAAPTRTTRAASRQKAAPAQVLSPKNSNPRQKPAKPATRPR